MQNTAIPLNLVRSQKAKRPSQQHIEQAIQDAKEKYNKGAGRAFLPEIYTR